MAGDRTLPSETVTRKPDDDVGKSGKPPAGGGKRTAQQAAITDMGKPGRTDQDRGDGWQDAGGAPGRNPAPVGGSSGGHSDQKGAGDAKVAQGHYKVEKESR